MKWMILKILTPLCKKCKALEECHESSEGASVNANRILRNWGCNMARRPQAGGAVLPPILKNEVGIYRCARARHMASTLLLHKLKPQERAAIGHFFKTSITLLLSKLKPIILVTALGNAVTNSIVKNILLSNW